MIEVLLDHLLDHLLCYLLVLYDWLRVLHIHCVWSLFSSRRGWHGSDSGADILLRTFPNWKTALHHLWRLSVLLSYLLIRDNWHWFSFFCGDGSLIKVGAVSDVCLGWFDIIKIVGVNWIACRLEISILLLRPWRFHIFYWLLVHFNWVWLSWWC